jgi:hypothetical protein
LVEAFSFALAILLSHSEVALAFEHCKIVHGGIVRKSKLKSLWEDCNINVRSSDGRLPKRGQIVL